MKCYVIVLSKIHILDITNVTVSDVYYFWSFQTFTQ